MRLFTLIVIGCCVSACASKFVFSKSTGYITGWERDGFFSVLHDKKIRFEVNNSYVTKSSEILFGFEHLEKNVSFQQSSAFETRPFIITAFFETASNIYFEDSYKLVLNGKTYNPVKVIVGDRDKNIYSCLTSGASESKGFVVVGNNQCILFVFDFNVPPPDQAFNLMLVMRDGNDKLNLDVAFIHRMNEEISTH